MDQTLLILGDTNIQNREDPFSAFVNVRDMLTSADVLFGQLEGPLAEPSIDPARPDIPHQKGWRHSGAKVGPALKKAGYVGVSCASNVAYPARAAVASVKALDSAGILHCGVGETLAEARKPVIIEKNGVRFGFLSYTSVFWPSNHAASANSPGCATIKAHAAYEPGPRALEMPGAEPITHTFADADELEAMRDDVRALRTKVDLVILSCHWGVSSKEEPVAYQREIARAAIDVGADMVFGHHPHVVQAGEIYQGKPIFYSLGNFAFDWDVMRGRHLDGLALRCLIAGKKITEIELLPVRRNEHNDICVHSADTGAGKDILGRFEQLSRKLGDSIVLSRATHLRLEGM
ncbi:CapA family protein [Bradyrhizobium brasilense]|uniref:CapA family protein n=1 Tax=Bradyrhizobium brasilense TaxID=1419277 RepID=UPI0014573043|nr:CapA family protein [Bradyrhizobium brasilense]NLS75060.1 CapA family protein [Bradyrhizobium brasilense]